MNNEKTVGIIINAVPVKFSKSDKTMLKIQYGIPCEIAKDFVGYAVFDSYNDVKVGSVKLIDFVADYIGKTVEIELTKILQANNSIKLKIAKIDDVDVL